MFIAQQQLKPLNPSALDNFGISAAISADTATILVGASKKNDDPLFENGDAYVFNSQSGTWTQQQELQAQDRAPEDSFGQALALSGDGQIAFIGAYNPDQTATGGKRAVYIFTLNGAPCSTANECASGYCVDKVCCSAACGGDNDADCQACSRKTGAPVDGVCSFLPPTVVCRAEDGVCDLAETCTGTQGSCPDDGVASPTQLCQESTDPANPASFCDGKSKSCDAAAASPSLAGGCFYTATAVRSSAARLGLGLRFLLGWLAWRHRRAWALWLRRKAPGTLALLGLLTLLRCNHESLTLIDIDPESIPAGTTRLQLLTTLEDRSSTELIMDVPHRLAVYLPRGDGTVTFELDALNDDLCKLGVAQVKNALPGGLRESDEFTLKLNQLAGPYCTLSLRVDGDGTIFSTPAGIQCDKSGDSCAADFPSQTQVQLNASAPVVNWMNLCDVPSASCTLALAKSQQLTVSF